MRPQKRKIFIYFFVLFFCFSFSISAEAKTLGENQNFYLDPVFDLNSRKQISSQLIFESSKLYFYIDNSLWQLYSSEEKSKTISNLSSLANEFDNNIYPALASNYGTEWNPGVDNDSKITLLFHQLKRGAGGYFNSGNEYSKYEVPVSNEREMVYLNSDYIASPLLKRLLAHEFTHLITFNQKDMLNNIEEDVWLNEARAEYAITLCGYNDNYQDSNLQKRAIEFLKNPNDSLTEWKGVSSDYGVLNMFTQYLVDYYGVKILNDSLHLNKKGIDSINYALINSGFSKTFADIFYNWTITVLVNDCSFGPLYCYKNPNLKNLKIIPTSVILPENPEYSVFINYAATDWSGLWDKISGKTKNLNIEFSGSNSNNFKIFYLLCVGSGKCELIFPGIAGNKLSLNNLGTDYAHIVAVAAITGSSSAYSQFSWKINSSNFQSGQPEDGASEISRLLERIESLKKQIADLQAMLAGCEKIKNNLYFGLINNSEVSCLQQFLKNQGPNIYPEGLITGNFYNLTKNAVIRFQEKYSDEIIKPLGLTKGTGVVGPKTRGKINQLLK